MVLAFIIARSLGTKFKVKQWLYEKLHGISKNKGYIIIVGKKTTENSAKNYIKKDAELSQISEDAIAFVETSETFAPGNVDDFMKKFEKMHELLRMECEEDICHLFLQCPVSVAAMIGGYLYNKSVVYVYNWGGTTYTPFGCLKR
jgi:hypothetical protein